MTALPMRGGPWMKTVAGARFLSQWSWAAIISASSLSLPRKASGSSGSSRGGWRRSGHRLPEASRRLTAVVTKPTANSGQPYCGGITSMSMLTDAISSAIMPVSSPGERRILMALRGRSATARTRWRRCGGRP